MTKELLQDMILHQDLESAFTSVASKVNQLNLPVETEDRAAGKIVARCLILLVNLFLSRCWSDKLIFEIAGIDAGETRVRIYAVPNWFRFKVGTNEKPVEPKQFLSRWSTDG
jgi:hypothetical protein